MIFLGKTWKNTQLELFQFKQDHQDFNTTDLDIFLIFAESGVWGFLINYYEQ